MSTRRGAAKLGLAFLIASLVVPSAAAGRRAPRQPPPAILAVLENGVNVLHEGFRFAPGVAPRLPAGLPAVETVSLPTSGTFEQRRDAARGGPLGNLREETLYHVAGTRLLLYRPADSPAMDVFRDSVHGTGVASAAIGLRHGTNPDAFLVVVIHPQPTAPGWEWLTKATWIDVISTSYNNIYARPVPVVSCPEGRYIRAIAEQGRMVFTAAGNGEQLGEAMSPSGFPDAYQVGGVDEDGRTWLPHYGFPNRRSFPNRPYETGDRYNFLAADSESLDGEANFGGTSGAAPSTAGRATELITFARALLGSRSSGVDAGVYARGKQKLPQDGPLRDGDLTAAELTELLHHTAEPAEPEGPARYLVEGYGALSNETVALAKDVLTGRTAMPQRNQEDEWHQRVEAHRELLFPPQRCT